MSPHTARAQVLIQQGRFDLAQAALGQALQQDPEDGLAHAWMGLTLIQSGRHDRAARALREAARLMPDHPYPHYLMALSLLKRDRFLEAREEADEAIRLGPNDASHYAMRARVDMGQERWAQALEWTERGLALDPEDAELSNLRGMVLTQLGRREEAGASIAAALRSEPDNAFSHANQGWRLLHANQPKPALEHFQEALRLEPGHEWARAGLVEALKARYLVYRLMLGYFLWMSRLPANVRTGLIIGAYVLYQVLRVTAQNSAAARPWVVPVIAVYVAFVVLTWVSTPLFNLLIRLNKYGRHALDAPQRRGSNAFGAGLLLALAFGVTGLVTGAWGWYAAAGGSVLLGVVFGHALGESEPDQPNPRLTLAFVVLAGLVVAGAGLAAALPVLTGLGGLVASVGLLVFVFWPVLSRS